MYFGLIFLQEDLFNLFIDEVKSIATFVISAPEQIQSGLTPFYALGTFLSLNVG